MKRLLRCAVIGGAVALLSGCIIAEPPPPYGYAYAPYAPYAYAPAYPVVGLGVGACFGCGHFHRW